MGLSDYWGQQRRISDALSFISTNDLSYNSLNVQGSIQQGCVDSSDCASGFACFGGLCKQEDTGAGGRSNGSASGCGGGFLGGGGSGKCGPSGTAYKGNPNSTVGYLNSPNPGSNFVYNQGGDTRSFSQIYGIFPSSGCGLGGCGGSGGGNGRAKACCGGKRCCKIGSAGVQCFCGDCPPNERCNVWCTDYLATYGELGQGCSESFSCDECQNCEADQFGDFSCKVKTRADGPPCWCPNGGCNGRCDVCDEDSGSCREDCSTCATCYTTFKSCDCGNIKVKCCYTGCNPAEGFSECRAAVKCNDECGFPPDPCAGECRTVTTCDSEPPPPCPPKASCRTSGIITVGSRTCTLKEICDKSNVPDSCGECDCNCSNDCGSCKICNSNGKCVTDPACNTYYSGIVIFLYERASASNAFGNCVNSQESFPQYGRVAFITGNLADPNDLGMGYSWQKTGTVGPPTINPIYDDPNCNPALGFSQGPFTVYRVLRSDGSVAPAPGGPVNTRRRFTGTYSSKPNTSSTVTTFKGGSTFAIFGFGSSSAEAAADRQAKQAAQGYP